MSSLSYNPNIDISAYHSNDRQSYGGTPIYQQDTSRQMMSQMDPRVDPRMMETMQPMMQQPMMQQPMMRQPMMQPMMQEPMMQPMTQPMTQPSYYNKKRKYNSLESLDVSSNKFNWMLIFKKIAIYAILFLIMSHIKMNEIVCNFMPFLNNNEILCMTTKGIIMAILIILIQLVL